MLPPDGAHEPVIYKCLKKKRKKKHSWAFDTEVKSLPVMPVSHIGVLGLSPCYLSSDPDSC